MSSLSQSFLDRATDAACKMLVDGLSGRQKRFQRIRRNEASYNSEETPALKGRSNVPFDGVVMGGYIDTLQAGIATDLTFKLSPTREQDKLASDKMTAVMERETAQDRGALNDHIQDAKFLASLAGRGFIKPVFASKPFKMDFLVPDHYDMVVELTAGRSLDAALFKFQNNIFRDAQELLEGTQDGYYDKAQVAILKTRQNDSSFQKQVYDEYYEKASRLTGFGINFDQNNYVGQSLFNLTEGVFRFEGKWVYLFFDPKLKTWIRGDELVNVFEHAKEFPGRGPWASFATNPHPHIFWSKAPADDIYPVGYAMKKIVNGALDNIEKRNWDMKAYDPKIFRNPEKLLYRPDALVKATLRQGKSISDGIYRFETPENANITINLVQWLDNFLGQKSGITPDAQGASKEKRVGVLVSNMEQVSKRFKLDNRSFRECAVAIGSMCDYGIYEHMREKYAVKLIGNEGIFWDEEVSHQDASHTFAITVSDGLEAVTEDAEKAESRRAGFQEMSKDPDLRGVFNPQWKAREYLKMIGYSPEEIRLALDKMNDPDERVLAKAAQAIADCLEGKDLYLVHKDATTGFIQKILKFVDDKFPIIPAAQLAKLPAAKRRKYREGMEKRDKLVAYAEAHLEIAQKNMEDLAASVIARGGMLRAGGGEGPLPGAPGASDPSRLLPGDTTLPSPLPGAPGNGPFPPQQ